MNGNNIMKLIFLIAIIGLVIYGIITVPTMIKSQEQLQIERDEMCSNIVGEPAVHEQEFNGWGKAWEYCITKNETIEIKYGKVLRGRD